MSGVESFITAESMTTESMPGSSHPCTPESMSQRGDIDMSDQPEVLIVGAGPVGLSPLSRLAGPESGACARDEASSPATRRRTASTRGPWRSFGNGDRQADQGADGRHADDAPSRG